MLSDLLRRSASEGFVRNDIPAPELATYCLHALEAAGALSGKAALRRLVRLTFAALEPRQRPASRYKS